MLFLHDGLKARIELSSTISSRRTEAEVALTPAPQPHPSRDTPIQSPEDASDRGCVCIVLPEDGVRSANHSALPTSARASRIRGRVVAASSGRKRADLERLVAKGTPGRADVANKHGHTGISRDASGHVAGQSTGSG